MKENNSKNLDSKIITFQHTELISEWIKESDDSNIIIAITSIFSRLVSKDIKNNSNSLYKF